jgi:hypothetical protein
VSDRLALANAIEDAGIPRDKAERLASVIFDTIHDNVATKADLQLVRADLQAMETRLTLHGLAALISGLGILFGALHLWPPH